MIRTVRYSEHPALQGFTLFEEHVHDPNLTSMRLSLVATREHGKRMYRVAEGVPYDTYYLQFPRPEGFRFLFEKLERDLAGVVAEYEAANPVEGQAT